MDKMALIDEAAFPDEGVLRSVLGDVYPVYQDFVETIQSGSIGLVSNWKYYRDGKSWLCKITHKKKTIFWLSVYNGYFKVCFYFTEKTGAGISTLGIDGAIINGFTSAKPIGRLKPVILTMLEREQLNDVYVLIAYKKKCA